MEQKRFEHLQQLSYSRNPLPSIESGSLLPPSPEPHAGSSHEPYDSLSNIHLPLYIKDLISQMTCSL
jgi:hypothetical protein